MAYDTKVRDLIKKKHEEGYSYREISEMMNIPKASIQYILKPTYVKSGNVGRPKSLSDREKSLIKKEIMKLKNDSKRITSTKISTSCNLSVSQTTLQKVIKEMLEKDKKIPQTPRLKQKNKLERIKKCRDWFEKARKFDQIIFSDECSFSLGGPDKFLTWQFNPEIEVRRSRHSKVDGGVMIWGCMGPDGLLYISRITDKCSKGWYLSLLKKEVLPFLSKRYGKTFIFQQDNAPCHKAKIVVNYLKQEKYNILEWPSCSPDLSPIGDAWHILKNMVYDGRQFKKNDDLWETILENVEIINREKKLDLISLHKSLLTRGLNCIQRNGFGLEGDVFPNVTCEGDTMRIECASGYAIKILHAFFGREQSIVRPDFCLNQGEFADPTVRCFLDVKTLVEYKCNYERYCDQKVDGNLFSIAKDMGSNWTPSECPKDTKRFLMVDYACERIKIAEACYGEKLYANCPKNYKIKQHSVFFGRLDGKTCLPKNKEFYSQAEYGIRQIDNYYLCHYNQSIVSSTIQSICEDKETCIFNVHENLLENYPSHHENKCPKDVQTYLQFYYVCSHRSSMIQDLKCYGETFQPSCGKGYLINIKSSFRGRLTPADAQCETEPLENFKGPCQTELITAIAQSIEKCHLKSSCSLPNTDTFWSKLNATNRVCSESDKPFMFHLYECKPRSSIIACPKTAPKTIECPKNYAIKPISAFFGRHNDVNCLDPNEEIEMETACFSDSDRVLSKVNEICRGKRACNLEANASIFYDESTDSRMRCREEMFYKQYLWVNYECSQTKCLFLSDKLEAEIEQCISDYKKLCILDMSDNCFRTSLKSLEDEKDCLTYTRRLKAYYEYWLPAHKKTMCNFPKCAFNFARKVPEVSEIYRKIADPQKHYVIDPVKCTFIKEYGKLSKEGSLLEQSCPEGSAAVMTFYADIFGNFEDNHDAIIKGCPDSASIMEKIGSHNQSSKQGISLIGIIICLLCHISTNWVFYF
ncbi:DgyrCDS10541 [Dimorphilus gyrociliatus]|uniref:DgyrCDS10541 n=1 Tax=Dimorphilus gyrociliatus TaxID=2664684 RepID=A0A7I8W0L9_9ANNE|nr:DgyrCDS10541 [Dimorphilus gyrociliatus]